MSMDWVKDYYAQKSQMRNRAVVSKRDRKVAQWLGSFCEELSSCERILELGAGNGGVASAMADLGYEVFAVEFNPYDITLAKELAHEKRRLHVIEADFYQVQFDEKFDFIYYWDGFGIGSDSDQRRLLTRIGSEWLSPRGCAVIEVFSPWKWALTSGKVSTEDYRDGTIWQTRVEFDSLGSRMVHSSHSLDDPDQVLSQTIRLYSIPEFQMLVEGTGINADIFYHPDGETINLSSRNSETIEQLLKSSSYIVRLINDIRDN